MTQSEDPRLTATRDLALDSALKILLEDGVLAVTHASISKVTGISRSTLYRHWPEIAQLRNNAFKRATIMPASIPSKITQQNNGPLHADLTRTMGALMYNLNETPWRLVAPQVIAAAATDEEAKDVINDLMQERIAWVESIFAAAEVRGELQPDVPVRYLVEMAIAVPYFRKFIAGLPLDQDWLETHVNFICSIAEDADGK